MSLLLDVLCRVSLYRFRDGVSGPRLLLESVAKFHGTSESSASDPSIVLPVVRSPIRRSYYEGSTRNRSLNQDNEDCK